MASTGFGRSFGGILRRKPPATEEVGASGAWETGGHLVSNERNPKARGLEKWRTYSDLLANVAIVAAGARAFLNLTARATWSLVPADTDNEADATRAQEAADLVLKVIHDMERPWSRVVRRSATYRFYGFSIQEWTAKKRKDGTIGMLDVAPRPQATISRWDLDDPGNVLGVAQRIPKTGKEVYLPRAKIIHIVDDALSDSPEGVGLFRHLIESNHRLKNYQLLEAIGFETDLKGIPVGRAPYGKLAERVKKGEIDEAQRKQILAPLEDFISNHIRNQESGLALDSLPYLGVGENEAVSGTLEWDIKLLQGTPTSAAEVAAAIERITREMALVLGVQGLLLGGDGSGSLALGRVFADQFALIVDSALGELAEAYEHDLIPPILALNGIDEDLAPSFAASRTQHFDVEQITQALRDLSDSGAPLDTDDPVINAIRDMLGVPQVDLDARAEAAALLEEEEDDDPPPPSPPPPIPPDQDADPPPTPPPPTPDADDA